MSVELQENKCPGSVVKHIEVISTSSLLFEITGGNEENVFAINPATGTVTTKDKLDYEGTKTYDLTIMAMNMVRIKCAERKYILLTFSSLSDFACFL